MSGQSKRRKSRIAREVATVRDLNDERWYTVWDMGAALIVTRRPRRGWKMLAKDKWQAQLLDVNTSHYLGSGLARITLITSEGPIECVARGRVALRLSNSPLLKGDARV